LVLLVSPATLAILMISQVLNLFSVDVDRIADFGVWSFSIVDAPAELIIGTIFLYRILGYASLVGIAANILFLPANHFTSKNFASVQDKLMAARDRRGASRAVVPR
jgi:hypothetical protein